MKKKRFLILIEDDFEISGNGLGNVASLQYSPGIAFMNIAKKHGIKLTFMVDVAQQLFFSRYSDVRSIRMQKELLDHTILLMMENNFDVQLHLHPQWLNAQYRDGFFYVDDNWNIGNYNQEQQASLISNAVNYLDKLIKPEFPEYKVCAFKAGSWGLQPSSNSLLTALGSSGISIIMGARDGLTIPSAMVDYSNMEEKYLPYYPDFDDVTKISLVQSDMVMLPLQPYEATLLAVGKLISSRFTEKFRANKSMVYQYDRKIPNEIKNLTPIKNKKIFRLSLKPYTTHLKIGNQNFSYLKTSFDSVIHRLRNLDEERIPIVIESHTKQFDGFYPDIDRFIGYILENYSDEVEFGDMSSYSKERAHA